MSVYNSSHTGQQIDGNVNTALPRTEAQATYLSQANAAATYMPQTNLFFLVDQEIAVSDWAADATYTAYPYKAVIHDSRVTANTYCEVVFNLADATSGYFAPICNSVSGGIEIWASSVPLATITIPTIKCTVAISSNLAPDPSTPSEEEPTGE